MTALHMYRRRAAQTLLLAAVALQGCMFFMKPPADPKAYERTQASAAQMYRATFTPAEVITVGRMHKWNIVVTNADGTPVDSAKIIVDGGMPQHGHGLPTKPLVTAHLGEGKHVVDGMKFNMGGWWVVKLTIDGAKGSDVVTFNLKL
jgi:hypothetical protein